MQYRTGRMKLRQLIVDVVVNIVTGVLDALVVAVMYVQQYPAVCGALARCKEAIQYCVYRWKREPSEWDCWCCFSTLHSEDEYFWNESDVVYLGNVLDYDLALAKTKDGRRGVRVTKPEDRVFRSRTSSSDAEANELDASSELDWRIPSKAVKNPFLSVKYKACPDGAWYIKGMPQTIEQYIDLGSEYFYEGNELFSAAFVYRWLQYHGTVPFYDDYTLELLDGRAIQMVNLKNTQYIRLDKNGSYTVHSR